LNGTKSWFEELEFFDFRLKGKTGFHEFCFLFLFEEKVQRTFQYLYANCIFKMSRSRQENVKLYFTHRSRKNEKGTKMAFFFEEQISSKQTNSGDSFFLSANPEVKGSNHQWIVK
jgi:hypothetical protein